MPTTGLASPAPKYSPGVASGSGALCGERINRAASQNNAFIVDQRSRWSLRELERPLECPAQTRHAEARAGEGLVRATLRIHGQTMTMCTRRAALHPEELIAEIQVAIALFEEDIARAKTRGRPSPGRLRNATISQKSPLRRRSPRAALAGQPDSG